VGAAAFLALILVLSRFLDPEALAARVEPRVEAALSRDVEISRVEVALFPLGVRLRDVSVADPTGLAPFLARVGSVEFRVALLPLLRREVTISRLVLESPEADLRVGPDGHSNFGDLSPQAPEEAGPAGVEPAPESFSLELNGIRVSGGQLHFQRLEDSTSFAVADLRIRASVQHDASGPWVFVGDSEGALSLFSGSSSSSLEGVPLSLTFDLETGSAFEDVEIRTGSLGLDPLALTVSGRIEGFKEPIRTLSLSLEGEGLPLDRLVAALSDHFQLDVPGKVLGTMDAALQVAGELGPGATPRVSGTVNVIGGGLEARDGTLAAQDLSVELELQRANQLRYQIAGEVLDGPFSMEGNGSLGEEPTMSFRLQANPDLALIPSVMRLPEGVSAAGRVEARVRVNVSPQDLRSLRVWGDASPNGVHLTHPALGVPVDLPRGRVSLVGNGANFVDLPLSLGEDDLVLTGEIQNIASYGIPDRTVGFRGTVRGPRLDLTQISTKPPPDPNLTYGKVAFARMGDRAISGQSPEDAARELRLARPDSLPVSGELQVALDTLIYAKGRIEEVRARVEFGPSLVRVTEESHKQFGGDVWTSMNLALGSRAQEPFNISLRVRDLDAGEFFAATSPLGESLQGKLSLDLDLVGDLDELLLPGRRSLVGSGRFSLTEGGIQSVPLTQALSSFMGITGVREPQIRDWATSFLIENGGIRLADGRLSGAVGEPVVGGSIGFGGELNLLSIFEINADNLGAYALDNLGIHDDLAGRIPGRPGMVQAIVRIGGTILAPELQGDPGAMAQNLTQAVKEEAQAEAQRQIEQQRTQLQNRATGFLRNLLQPRDTTGGAVPDTVRGDTLRPDTIPPDTVRHDTIKPDTIIPDTIKPDTIKPDTVPPGALPGGSLPVAADHPHAFHPGTLQSGPFRKALSEPPARHAP
jgi:hypothetical protein